MSTLLFSLMCRCNNASKISLAHIALSPSKDSITIVLPVTKGDQEGFKTYPRTVHDNPNDPYWSVYLAFFVHVFTRRQQTITIYCSVVSSTSMMHSKDWMLLVLLLPVVEKKPLDVAVFANNQATISRLALLLQIRRRPLRPMGKQGNITTIAGGCIVFSAC